MGVLVGFGSTSTVLLWLVALGAALWWLARQARAWSLVTVPAFAVFFWFLLPILLQYPFALSPLNSIATGVPAYEAYWPQVDRSLRISLAGMAAFVITFAATSKAPRPNLPTTFIARALSAWSHSGLLWAGSLGVVVLFVFLSSAGLMSAEGMRSRAMETPGLRPIYNLAVAILPTLVAIALLSANERRKAALWGLVVLLLLPALLTGSRGVAFGGIFNFALTMLGYRSLRGELKVRRLIGLVPAGLAVLLLVFYVGDVRDGQYSIVVTAASFGLELFYGNNFSDLRDFAWLLGYWDGEWLGGRTQLAGLLGFIPAVLSPFRTNWGWGRVSTDIVGLGAREVDSAHPGLRPGVFGELYLNFGVVGVVLGGLLLGYCVARLHAATRHAIACLPPFEAKLVILAAFTALGLLWNLYVTAALFGVYVTLAALVIALVAKGIVRAGVAARPVTAQAYADR
jgi:hypothetical protein